MVKIQIDIPEELLNGLKHAFEMRVSTAITVSNRQLIVWGIEQYVSIHKDEQKDKAEVQKDKAETHITTAPHSPIPSLEDALETMDNNI